MAASGAEAGNATSSGTWRSCFPGEEVLDFSGFEKGAEEAARELLGCHLLSLVGDEPSGGRIVETEAYVGPRDPACHAAERTGRTRRNAPMFGPAGTAYVYFVYGMHWCFNVVAGRPGDPEAVLIRGVEPGIGVELMRERRGRESDLTNGPARLCQAMAIDGSMNEHPLSRPPLLLLTGPRPEASQIGVSGRIGIREARDWPLRFFLKGHPDVSPASPGPSGPTGAPQ